MPKSLKVAFYISIVLHFLRRIRRKVLDGRALAALKLWDEAVKNWNKDHGCFVAPLIPKWVEPYLPEERENPEDIQQMIDEQAEYYEQQREAKREAAKQREEQEKRMRGYEDMLFAKEGRPIGV